MSNNSFDVLLSLPSGPLFSLLSEWVGLKELSALDVAFCNHEKRDDLMSTFSSEGFVLGEEVPIGETNYISWVTKRQIRQEKFYVYGTMSDFVEYTDQFGKYVKRVTIVSDVTHLAKALSACCGLERLRIIKGGESKATLNAISHCASLRELRVGLDDYKHTKSHPHRNDSAPLQLSTLIVAYGSASTKKIVRMTSPTMLVSLQVSLSKYFRAAYLRKYLSKGCRLQALCLEGWLSNKGVISLLKLCPDLRHLEIDCSSLTEQCVPQLAFELSQLHLKVLCLNACPFAHTLLPQLAQQGCETLQGLFLNHTLGVGNAINCVAGGLTKLKIRLLVDEEFAAMDLRLLSNLTHLMVGMHISLLTKDFLDGISTHCTKLTHLAMSMNDGSPYDFIPILGNNLLPALSFLHVFYVDEWDTSELQLLRPNLYICQAKSPSWHSFEDIVCKTGHNVW